MVLGLVIVRHRHGSLQLRWEPRLVRSVMGQSFPLFALMVLGILHFGADTLMLGFLKPYEEVARYEAGAKLLEASQFLVRPV